MNQDINFWKVRDLGEIINATFAFVKAHIRNLLSVILYTAGPFLLLQALLSIWFQSRLVIPSPEEQIENPFAVFSMFTDVRFYLAIVAGMIGSFILYAAMYSYVMIARDNEEPTVDLVWQRIREDAGIYLTTFLALLGGYILSVPLLLIPCLGALAWLVGAVYLASILLVYLPARLHERIGPIEAIGRCNRLNKGHFVDSFLVLVVLVVLMVVLALVFLTPSMVISFIYGLNSLGGLSSGGPLWTTILSTVLTTLASLITIIPITATILHYCNLVERSESPGLADRIEDWAIDQGSDDSPGIDA